MILHNLEMTCSACPTQWEATNERGEAVYIRYRYDNLTVYCPFGQSKDNYGCGPIVFARRDITGEPLCGVMETNEMLRITGYTEARE